ncbi:MAG: hypothetical protein H6837_01205 [Planctomycetes bacterium]|nr:hypothetical protein [Planctomycetota bacterium]
MHRSIRTALPVALLALVTSLTAQTQKRVFISDGNPSAGSSNTFPWSQEGLRYQLIFTAAQMGNVPCVVNDILVAPQLSMTPSPKTAVYDDIEIRMGMTSQSVPTTNWSTNNPNPTVVYRGPLRATFETGKWREMGLPKTFLYLPLAPANNLCVEIIQWKFNPARRTETVSIRAVTAPSTVTRAFYYLWTTAQATPPTIGSGACKMGLICDNGSFAVTETGCQSSRSTPLSIGATTFPQWGKPFGVTLTGALPTSPVFLAIGLSDTIGFGTTLPIDGALLGAPGCFLWNENRLQVGSVTDGTGAASLNFTIPAGGGNPRLYVHWWNLDNAANALGVTTSNYGKILLGT